MGAGTSGACLRCKQHPTGRNQAQPAPTSNTLKLTALVGDQIPHAVGVVPKEHGVVAGGHRSTAAPFRQVVTQLFTGGQVERPLIGVICVANHHRVLQMPAMVSLALLVVILPEEASCRYVN